MKGALVLTAVVLTAGLAGCIGTEDARPADAEPANATNVSPQAGPSSEADATDETTKGAGSADADQASTDDTTDLNPWQRGLDDDYPTPDVAKQRSAEEREANVAEPGDPEFAAFDAKVQAWMEKHNITAGQLALMDGGRLVYERGYGHVDRAETKPANASTMFRIASVTKPMTKALVAMQVEQGLYNWSDPVFCLGEDPGADCRLPIDAHPVNPVEDDRIGDVTVGHLVNHTGGWGDEANWVQFGEGAIQIADELGIASPPSAWRTAQYLMGEELVHDPGAEERYCNVCYMLAGLVAEAATGAELGALYEAYLFEPLEIEDDIEPGGALPEDRNPREPFYACEYGTSRNVFDPNETVCWPDGGWSMQTELANGGLVASASAVAAVYEAYTEHAPSWFRLVYDAGVERVEVDCSPSATCRWHTGAFPGTSTGAGVIEDDDGKAQFVFLFNSLKPHEACESPLGGPFELVYLYECGTHDLLNSMFYQTAAWETNRDLTPGTAAPTAP